MIAVWILIGVAVVLLLWLVVLYNRLVRLRNGARNAWAQVDVQLRRRYDLIPNLVETVKGYASHERETFDEVTRARASAQSAEGPAAQAQAESFLTQALGRLFAVAEAYPQLRATENFQQLQAQLAETENQIQVARQLYNDSVLSYNNTTQTLPSNIVAGLFGFGPREFFETEEQAVREAPRVSFTDGGTPPPTPPPEPARTPTPPAG